jgi:hypothetical protein
MTMREFWLDCVDLPLAMASEATRKSPAAPPPRSPAPAQTTTQRKFHRTGNDVKPPTRLVRAQQRKRNNQQLNRIQPKNRRKSRILKESSQHKGYNQHKQTSQQQQFSQARKMTLRTLMTT